MATVTISDGKLKGANAVTESGFEYFEFLGIPYAKPPVGELRFKSPESPEPWEGVREPTSTDSTAISCQVDFNNGSVSGSEDCLYLNVYTPQLPTGESKFKPVMVYFHGGGFFAGNGNTKSENNPDFLIENDVIIVSVNYRLGVLGFLCLDIPEAAGNMGLKDQVKALHWVRNNIERFGGDKDNVTIFGMSAGSASCEFLLLSPLAKGLFHKAILQSGSTLNNWAINFPRKAKLMAMKLAVKLGYTGSDEDIDAIYQILFEASASELTETAFKITINETSQRIFFGFVPVIEENFGDGEAFLVDTPYTILKEGKFNKVPVIRGFCNSEGSLAKLMKPHGIKELIQKKSFVDYWAYFLEDADEKRFNSLLINNYVHKAHPIDDSQKYAVQFFGDLNFAAGVYFAGKLQCDRVPVYMYRFCYDGKLNASKASFDMGLDGAAHGDDFGYILNNTVLSSKTADESDVILRSRMTKMWTNFAKCGHPAPEDSSLPIYWPAFRNDTQEYLNIDKEFTIEANYEPEKMAIFEEITKKYERYKSIFRSGVQE